MAPIRELLGGFPAVIDVPLAWGEMDAFQHVNNIIYFRWFESARIAYFEAIRLTDLKEETGIGPILHSTSCRFRIPLTYPDTVSVGTRISEIGEDRFRMLYRAVSHSAERVAADGDGMIVSFDYRRGRKAPIPESMRASILDIEQRAGNEPAAL